MDRAEKITKLVIEAILPARLEYRVQQSNGKYDFDLEYFDGRLAALEATASIDRAQLEFLAAIKRQKKGAPGFPAEKCRSSWMISARSSARATVLRQKLDIYLSVLELNGISRFSLVDLDIPSVSAICNDLEVEHGFVVLTSTPPAIYVLPAGAGAVIDPANAIEAGWRESWKDDNRKKLRASHAAERHLVVYIDLLHDSAWTAMNWAEPPPQIPDLPPEITHIWLLAEGETPGEVVIWRAETVRSWQRQKHIIESP